MKVSVFYLALVVLTTQSLLASGQAIGTIKVTTELNAGENLDVLFKRIERQSGLLFIFDHNVISQYKDITLPKATRTIRETLDMALEGTKLKYRQVKENIIISVREEKETSKDEAFMINDDEEKIFYTIKGKVVDGKTQQPMPGVNIIVKGTNRGTNTDKDGIYAIDAEEGSTLVFSFIGYKAFETVVGGRTMIDISMEEDLTSLKEVEIRSTGYWTETKERSTANIAKVEGKDIERQPVTSPLMALQGRMAGVDITPYNGVAGSAVKVQIRGNNSLRWDGSYPLYVVDGVPIDSKPLRSSSSSHFGNGFDPLSTINPANIESIEVLKDGAATAIYGSRGANGVVLIRTKRHAVPGKTDVQVSFYKGIGEMFNRLEVLNTQEYLAMSKEAFANDGFPVSGSELLLWDTTRYTDWQKELLGGTAHISDAQVNISGGSGNTTFTLNGGFHQEGVIFPGDFGYRVLTGNFSFQHHSEDQKFNIQLSASYGANKNKQFDNANFLQSVLTLPPQAPNLYDEDGNLNWEIVEYPGGRGNTWTNPLSYLRNTHQALSNNFIVNGTIGYELLKGLIVKTNLGFTSTFSDELIKRPIAANSPTSITPSHVGSASFGNNSRNSWLVEPQISYSKKVNLHSFDFLVGSAFQQSTTSIYLVQGSGYNSDALLNSLQGAPNKVITVDDEFNYSYVSLFSRIGYSFNNKYSLDFTARRDGSSRFGPGNRFGNFGSLGAAWVFSNEGFVKNNFAALSFGKLRGSFATTGNDQIGDHQFIDSYRISNTRYQGAVTVYPNALFNPDFAWEVTRKLEGALELGFFENRISVEAAWFRNRSSNQLVQYPLPATTGFPAVLMNFDAVIENTGWEIVLNTANLRRDNFTWTTSLNVSLPRNELVEFPGIEESPYATMYKVGEPLSIQRLYTWTGVDPKTGEHTFLDLNQNEMVDDEDKQFMEPRQRQYFGGLINTIRYKGLELSFLLQFSKQNTRRYLAPGPPGFSFTNQPVEVLARWRNPGDITDVAKYTTDFLGYISYVNVLGQSDYSVENVSFIRLKTLSLSFTLPRQIIQKMRLDGANVFIQGQNLFTWDNTSNLDPETGSSMPPLRMVTLGAQFKF